MDIPQETINGFLIGTVATIVLKGFVDFFQKRIEFKREFKKIVYDKKLDAAENAVKAMYQNVQSSMAIINAIETVIDKDMDGELFGHIWGSYFKLIEQSESNLLNSTASMYFKLDNSELWSDEDQKNLLEVFSKIKIFGEEIQYYESELDKLPVGESYNKLEFYIENELRVLAKKELIKLKNLLRKSSNAVLVVIKQIKEEFSR